MVRTEEAPKYFWLDLSVVSSAEWDIDIQRPGCYRVVVALLATRSRVSVAVDGLVAATAEAVGPDWDLVDLGLAPCSAGPHRLSISIESVGGYDSAQPSGAIRSVELVHEDELPALTKRLADFVAAGTVARQRLRASNLGLMFQYGPWSYPLHGAHKPDLEEHVDAFDVERFADQMADLGVGHVIWSLTWWTYTLATPSSAVDRISGSSELTSRRDLVLDIATALRARGIRFLLYCHVGHDQHLPDGAQWWRAQHWPAEFSRTGEGDRSTALANLAVVLEELGERYGDLLDGWLVDDGIALYPAPFEQLGQALRAGHPGRLIGYNSWIVPRVTPFQDLDFGEGLRDISGLDIDEGGRLLSGPRVGLLAHAMTPLQAAWGVYAPEQQVPLDDWAEDGLQVLYDDCRAAGVPLTVDLLMWFPGLIDPEAVARLARLRGRVSAGVGAGVGAGAGDVAMNDVEKGTAAQ